MMFIGREKELQTLNRLYASGNFEFVVLYGRRRVGKTALINAFVRDKKAIFFVGIESDEKQNLDNLSRSILECVGGADTGIAFSSYQAALEYVFRISEKERIILAIDEYPYIARGTASFASTLQRLIDKYQKTSKMMLLLSGSSMSYMEDHVLAYKAPLYGRRTAQMKLLPFSFEETCIYLRDFQDEEKALLYGIFSGTPQYLLQIQNGVDVAENIRNTYLNPASALYEEPVNLLKQEVREPSVYSAIITAIASGASRMADICGKVGAESNIVAVYLRNLVTLGIVRKEVPFGEPRSKKPLYSITDDMFRFWYRFVPQNTAAIARGGADLVYRRIEPELPSYMGSVFEKICAEYLWKLLLEGKSPVDFHDIGRWWGTNPKTRKQEEIDLMGTGKTGALFTECKWTNEKADLGVLETLIRRADMFPYRDRHYFLFSKSGFTAGCSDKAMAMGNVTLVTFDDIMAFFQRKS